MRGMRAQVDAARRGARGTGRQGLLAARVWARVPRVEPLGDGGDLPTHVRRHRAHLLGVHAQRGPGAAQRSMCLTTASSLPATNTSILLSGDEHVLIACCRLLLMIMPGHTPVPPLCRPYAAYHFYFLLRLIGELRGMQVVGVLLAFYVVLHVLSYLALARLYRQRR